MRSRAVVLLALCGSLLGVRAPASAQSAETSGWRNLGGPGGCSVQALAANGRYLFAGTPFGIFVSTDEGGSWRPAGETSSATSGGASTRSIYAFGADIFACTRRGPYLSRDNGVTWTAVKSGLPEDAEMNCLVDVEGVLFCGLNHEGIYRSTDNGANWVAARIGLPDEEFTWISGLAAFGQALYAGYEYTHGVYRSMDSGVSWAPMVPALPGDRGVDFLVTAGRRLLAATGDGLFTIDDGGEAWSRLGEEWSADREIIFLASSGQAILAGLEDGRTFLSMDAGASWTQVSIAPAGDEPEFSGFVAIGPRLFVAVAEKGLFRSDDHGATWSPVETGFPSASDIPCVVRMGGDLFAAVRRWGAPGSLAMRAEGGAGWEPLGLELQEGVDLTCLEAAGANLIAGTEAGLFVSDDRGRTWSPVGPGGGEQPWVNCLETVGSSIFAGTNEGIFLSTDRGRTWVKKFPAPFESVGFDCFAEDGSALFAGGDQGVFASRDHGETWKPVNTGLPRGASCVSLASNGKVIVAGVTPPEDEEEPAYDAEGNRIIGVFDYPKYALFVSGDEGRSWTAGNTGLPATFRVSYLAASGSSFIAALEGYYLKAGRHCEGLFLSTNGGRSWTADWPGQWMAAPVNSFLLEKDEILAVTAGAGIWRLPLSALKKRER